MGSLYEDFDLGELLKNCLRKYYWFILSFLLFGLISVASWVFLTRVSPSYTCDAVVLIYPDNRDGAYVQDIVAGKVQPVELAGLKEAAGSYINLIQNPWVLDKAIENLSSVYPETDLEEINLQNIDAKVVESSPYLNVSVSFSDANIVYSFIQEMFHVFPEVMSELNISVNLSVISYPELPRDVDGLSLKTLILFSFVGAMLLGFLIVLFQQIFYKNFQVEKDVSRVLKMDYLGELPYYRKLSKRKAVVMKDTSRRLYSNLLVSGQKSFLFLDCYGANPNEKRDVVFEIARLLLLDGYKVLFLDFCGIDDKRKNSDAYKNLLKEKHIKYRSVKELKQSRKEMDVEKVVKNILSEDEGEYDYTLVNFPRINDITVEYFCIREVDMIVFLLYHKKTTQKDSLRTLKFVQKAGSKRHGAVYLNVSDSLPFSYYRQLTGL